MYGGRNRIRVSVFVIQFPILQIVYTISYFTYVPTYLYRYNSLLSSIIIKPFYDIIIESNWMWTRWGNSISNSQRFYNPIEFTNCQFKRRRRKSSRSSEHSFFIYSCNFFILVISLKVIFPFSTFPNIETDFLRHIIRFSRNAFNLLQAFSFSHYDIVLCSRITWNYFLLFFHSFYFIIFTIFVWKPNYNWCAY